MGRSSCLVEHTAVGCPTTTTRSKHDGLDQQGGLEKPRRPTKARVVRALRSRHAPGRQRIVPRPPPAASSFLPDGTHLSPRSLYSLSVRLRPGRWPISPSSINHAADAHICRSPIAFGRARVGCAPRRARGRNDEARTANVDRKQARDTTPAHRPVRPLLRTRRTLPHTPRAAHTQPRGPAVETRAERRTGCRHTRLGGLQPPPNPSPVCRLHQMLGTLDAHLHIYTPAHADTHTPSTMTTTTTTTTTTERIHHAAADLHHQVRTLARLGLHEAPPQTLRPADPEAVGGTTD